MCLRTGPAPPLPVKSKAIQLLRNNVNGMRALLITRASGLSTPVPLALGQALEQPNPVDAGRTVTHKMARLLDQMYTS